MKKMYPVIFTQTADCVLIEVPDLDILTEGKGTIFTDSQTAIAYIEREIKDKPRTHEQFIRHKHCEYWACQIRNRGVHPQKIKAHQKVLQTHSIANRFADLAANEGRAKFYER